MQACAKEAFLIGLSQFSDVSSGVSSEMSSDTPNECVLSSGNTYKRLRKRLSTSDDGLLFSEAQGFRHALSGLFFFFFLFFVIVVVLLVGGFSCFGFVLFSTQTRAFLP